MLYGPNEIREISSPGGLRSGRREMGAEIRELRKIRDIWQHYQWCVVVEKVNVSACLQRASTFRNSNPRIGFGASSNRRTSLKFNVWCSVTLLVPDESDAAVTDCTWTPLRATDRRVDDQMQGKWHILPSFWTDKSRETESITSPDLSAYKSKGMFLHSNANQTCSDNLYYVDRCVWHNDKF